LWVRSLPLVLCMTDLVVVFSPGGGGHKAAALAIVEEAKARGMRVELVNTFDHAPRFVGDAYLAAHLAGQNAAPEIYGHLYENANRRDGVFEPLRLEIDNLLFGDLLHHVRALAPRAVIATHHLPLVVLGRARTKGLLDAPLTGVVTDYTSHACWAEEGVDQWVVPCPEAATELAAHGARQERIAITGIPVRRAFERIPAPKAASPRLRVLVTSGGFGAAPMTRIVRSFRDVVNVDLTVVCGAKASKLEARVARAAREAGVSANVIGFESNMAARMAEAHIVVGKAGGLTVTETMTAGRPMVIASAVPGNEKLNEARVVNAGAGVAAAPEDVGLVIESLRSRSGLLDLMGRRARALVPCCAASRVLDCAFSLSSSNLAAAA
jgi:processive 1,2-diacylglycerol beta-glucosyltransferase